MFAAAIGLAIPSSGEVLDRVVASVGNTAITQSDIVQEYRFERFLDGNPPEGEPDSEESQAALSRLISQTLLAEQMRRPGRVSKNGTKNAEDTLKGIREKFQSEQAYNVALQSLGMTEAQVLDRLEIYQRTLQMINNRLRPMAIPDPGEIDDYYKKVFVPEYAKQNSGPPPALDQVRDQIREILVQKKMNQQLDDWLNRLKASHRVTIHSD